MSRGICIVAPLMKMSDQVSGKQDCGQCYQVDISIVVALISCDILLTVLIALSVYCCVSRQRRRTGLHPQPSDAGKGKQLTSSKKTKKPEVTESPYQELYGVQSDIYNDLRQYRK
ncbi:TYRO protein tyrosine kinase-binding protein [Alosa pseudoharengus]|uniref:TYRO protein tyrosine kinase-binding protein n=1 Tax=Alosa pseudoharengus TaxID=34774 RepID=UPI003F8B05B5